MNEWYLRDCSRKIKASKQVLGNSGGHLSAHAAYGYRKDPEDKHHWLIDEEAAPTVKRIYQLCIEGKGTMEIARILQRDKVESPAYYNSFLIIHFVKGFRRFHAPPLAIRFSMNAFDE